MRSLRAKLILLSTLLSSIVIIGLGAVSWHYMMRAVQEAVDLRLENIASRLIREANPWAERDLMEADLEAIYGDETGQGVLAMSVREYPEEREDPLGYRLIASLGWTETIAAALPFQFPVPDPDPIKHPELRRGKAGGPDRDPFSLGGPEEREFEAKPPPHGPPDHGPRLIEYCNSSIRGGDWRFIAVQERGYAVLAGLNVTRSNPGIGQLRRALFFGIPFALLLIGCGGWLVAERAMRPLREITATAARISVQDLSKRMPRNPHSDPEIKTLTEVLDDMMDRLEMSFTHASRFSADVAHELRTPITVMQGEIESALRECDPDNSEEGSLLVLREELNRLKSIIGSLMILSQADVGGLIRKQEVVSVSCELEAIAEDAEILTESAGISFESSIEEGLELSGDPVLLRQAFLNLINNAIKFNIEGGFVRVIASREGPAIRVTVENSGPGITVADKERIFDRFYRADRARSRGVDGFGLGLSLAKAIFEGHGGQLSLEEATPEKTRFAVRLKSR
ncbi:MAG: HAMP domain-containing protein [Verrucomicrobiales bacterium]|jgi:two-component system heavy metal sensor histidine kinase CusS|nr:HAMP domain-containing protein [Verrucomicrobiales bacterium]